MKISINKILSAAIFIVIAMVVFVLFISTRQTQRVHDTAASVSHTELVLTHIQNLIVSVLGNEASGRGYVITGKDQFLEQLKQSEKDITNELALLKTLTADNPVQQALCDSLSVYSNKRITFSKQTAALRLDKGLESASTLVSTSEGKFYTDKIRYLGNQMREMENALLEKRKNTNENSITQLQAILYSVLAAGFILSLALLQWIRLASNKQKLNEQKFSALLDAAPDATVIVNETGIIKMINLQMENLFGYKRNELIGQQVEILIPPELHDRHVHHRNGFIIEAGVRSIGAEIELRAVKKNGVSFPAEISLSNIKTSEGLLVSASIRDMTEKRKNEDALSKLNKELAFQNGEKEKRAAELSETLERVSFLATIADNIQDPVISTNNSANNNFIITRWNKPAEQLLEWKSEEVIGKNAMEIFKTDYPYETREQIFELLKANGFWQGEVIYHTKSGGPVHVLSTISYLKDATGNITGILVLIKDITKRKKAEEKLKEYQHFFSNSNDLCVIANVNGYFETVNPNFEKILGYSEKELLEKPFVEFIHPDDIVPTLQVYEQQKSEAKVVINFVNRYRKKDGSYVWLDWNSTPNPVTGKIYAIARDISDRKKAEDILTQRTAQLESANKELESFSYSVSHDLRAPLRIIDGFGQILKEDYSGKLDEEGRQTINTIMGSARKMGQLIDDLLNFSKIGRSEIRISAVDMNELVKEVLRDLKYSGISIPVHLKLNKLLNAKGDNNLLKQVWINLISNAIKYSGAKKDPVIEIGMVEKKDSPVYYIKDNGAGFDMQYAGNLFGVFQRFHKEADFTGTGVGLALVQRVIVRHGGSVWAEAKINEGATFYFTLPEHNKNSIDFLKN